MKLNGLFFSGIGVLIVVLSWPLFLGKVGPNRWYGLRVERTLANTELWYKANRILGFDLIVAGTVILIVSILTLVVDLKSVPPQKINLLVLVIAVGCAIAHSLFALSRL